MKYKTVRGVTYTHAFIAALAKRVVPHPMTLVAYYKALTDFIVDRNTPYLSDHPLYFDFQGYRAFCPLGKNVDFRVLYRQAEDYYIFEDIGSHQEVYGKDHTSLELPV